MANVGPQRHSAGEGNIYTYNEATQFLNPEKEF